MRRFPACLIALMLLFVATPFVADVGAAGKPVTAKEPLAPGAKPPAAVPSGQKPVPAPSSGTKPAAAPPPAKPATVWPQPDIQAAQLKCKALLATVQAETEPLPPVRKGPCGDPAPVRLLSVGSNPAIKIIPPPTLNCAMVVSVHNWMVKRVQPLAQRHLGAPIISVHNVASYTCRNRYGRAKGKLSEHARLNALDLAAFRTKAGTRIALKSGWGPIARVARERAEAAKRKAERTKRQAALAKAKPVKPITQEQGKIVRAARPSTLLVQSAPSSPRQPGTLRRNGHAENGGSSRQTQWSARVVPLHVQKAKPALVEVPLPQRKPSSLASKFLKGIHAAACGVFSTVLGPEANDAHKDHFHLDLAPRKWGNYCQ